MLAILNYLNAHNLPIFQLILMILVSKFMVHRALSDKTYSSLGLLSPLIKFKLIINWTGYLTHISDQHGLKMSLHIYMVSSRPCLTTHIMVVGECLHQSIDKKLQGLP